jgi:uncharacterized repeat protein (TIGR01451 family)
MRSSTRFRPLLVLVAVLLMLSQAIGTANSTTRMSVVQRASKPQSANDDETPRYNPKHEGDEEEGEREGDPLERDDFYYSRRTAGDQELSLAQAATLREQAAAAALALRGGPRPQIGPAAFSAWAPIGPDPIVQQVGSDGSLAAMSGRIGALAIRSTPPYTMYLGGAQGGVWISSTLTTEWKPVGDQFPTLSIGAIALAPSNENIVYVGTGEGALSGDSYYGVGILKSTDGGNTYTKVSGNTFDQVSISKLVVDPQNPDRLWVAVLRGRAGARRVSPPNPTGFGIYMSTNGGVTWTQQVTKTATTGATDLVIDPQTTGGSSVLLASFWTEGISKTVDGGAHWTTAMTGLPAGADYQGELTRFSLGLSHPSAGGNATVYTGFEYDDSNGNYHPSSIWKSTNSGANWAQTNTDVVEDFCGTQCTYDNVIGVDPTNANIVYALGLFNYDTGTGGVFRSLDGGATWRDLGWGLHPDYHAIAIRKDAPNNVLVGNDGGVWFSSSRGGRLNPNDPLEAVTWKNLNGLVNQDGTATGYNLQITQFSSIGQHPTNNRVYGGTQDNGTERKVNLPGAQRWFDFPSGDGGQVLVNPSNPNFVYGTYFTISPYRFDEGMATFNGNKLIRNGIDLNDRSDFYIPFAMDPEFPNRLYLGTQRVYRTDNADTEDAADVLWQAISPDLTSGCAGSAPNGARACAISALGATAGGPALYVGTLDGRVWVTTNANVASPTWTRVDTNPTVLPNRPVGAIAVNRSNYRTAYVAYNGFNDATPSAHGHVFKTTNGGTAWADVSGNLPDVPVNALVLDPSNPNTLYAGTDIGPYITTNANVASPTWTQLGGASMPIVSIEGLDLNPFGPDGAGRRLVAGTHGRGAWEMVDSTARPALQVRKSEPGVPVGPNKNLTYTITVKNTGNLTATNITIVDPVPANTTFVAAGSGGTLAAGNVSWTGLQVPKAKPSAPIAPGNSSGLVPGTLTVTFTVKLAGTLTTGQKITNDGITVASAQVATISGSPLETPIAPANAVALTPATQTDGTRSGQAVTYTVQLQNLGFNSDKFNLTTSGNAWPTTFWNASFTSQITRTGDVAPGATVTVGVKVSIPANQPNNAQDTATVRATSVSNPTKFATGTIKSLAVTLDILLVDNDAIGADLPDVESYYKAALTAAGYKYNYWDLEANEDLRISYMKAHKAIVWFTGASYPGPILPYEGELATFLNGGGKLFMSGQDILDQAAGTTDFVHDYLHIDWDGTDRQNDKATMTVTAVPTNTVFAGLGALPLDVEALGFDDFSDQITPIAPAIPAFRDQYGQTDALTVAAGSYKVVFLAWPFEALTSASDRRAVMSRSLNYFGLKGNFKYWLPFVAR